jgi:hypothetical protein
MVDLDEEAVEVLDFVDVAKCDMMLRPFHWKNPTTGAEGVKNMCSSLYITVREDALELKYSNVREIDPREAQLEIEDNSEWGTGLEDLGELQEQRAIGRGF